MYAVCVGVYVDQNYIRPAGLLEVESTLLFPRLRLRYTLNQKYISIHSFYFYWRETLLSHHIDIFSLKYTGTLNLSVKPASGKAGGSEGLRSQVNLYVRVSLGRFP